MKYVRTLLVGAVILLGALPASAEVLIPYEEFTLKNGLRVVVHEDRNTPIVNVSVWYHVGSKDEPRGKSGFAHLFEHIMFRGSENSDAGFADALEGIGVTGLNGTTSFDRTNYFSTAPTPGLERVLWLESDRMGHLLGAVTQEVLDDERGIVQNEKRQGENSPMGKGPERILAALYPEGHPYHHTTIGSMDDLNDASLEDVHGWFSEYYGAANALVVLAGDIDVAVARPLMEKYFGDIASGPALGHIASQVPKHPENSFEVIRDRVTQPNLVRTWAVPGQITAEADLLDMAAGILATGNSSWLYRELVEKRGLANSVSASLYKNEISSVFQVSVVARNDVDVSSVEEALNEVMAEFIKTGPAKREVERVKNSTEATVVRSLESMGNKGYILAEGALYANDPGHIDKSLARLRKARAQDIQLASREWLSRPYHQITYLPFGEFETAATGADRSKLPAVSNDLVFEMPTIQRATLSNGVEVMLAERHTVPLVEVLLDFGTANLAGLSNPYEAFLTGEMMTRGPANLTKDEFIDLREELGLEASVSANSISSTVSGSFLKKNLARSLSLWAGMLRRPAFRTTEFDTLLTKEIADREASKESAVAMAYSGLYAALYGRGHPYYPKAQWGDGIEEALKSLTIEELKAYHKNKFLPDQLTVFVIGDTTLPEITAHLEKELGNWKPAGEGAAAKVEIPDVPLAAEPRIIMIDIPDTPQTTILAGRVVPSELRGHELQELKAADNIFGGNTLTGRIGKNLRVDKGWAYGASSRLNEGLGGQGTWHVRTSVQTDRTADAMVETVKELKAITGSNPATIEELDLYVNSNIFELPGRYTRAAGLLRNMWLSYLRGLPVDDLKNRPAQLRALTKDPVNKAATGYLQPQNLTWALVGDLSKFEQQVRDLGIGEVEVWDTDGNRVR